MSTRRHLSMVGEDTVKQRLVYLMDSVLSFQKNMLKCYARMKSSFPRRQVNMKLVLSLSMVQSLDRKIMLS